MPHHDIEVKLEKNEDSSERAVPQLPPQLMVDDSVSYFTNDGEVTVVFGSPFSSGDVLKEGERRILRQEGQFFCQCSIKKPDGTIVEWSRKNPKSGGVHDVRPKPEE